MEKWIKFQEFVGRIFPTRPVMGGWKVCTCCEVHSRCSCNCHAQDSEKSQGFNKGDHLPTDLLRAVSGKDGDERGRRDSSPRAPGVGAEAPVPQPTRSRWIANLFRAIIAAGVLAIAGGVVGIAIILGMYLPRLAANNATASEAAMDRHIEAYVAAHPSTPGMPGDKGEKGDPGTPGIIYQGAPGAPGKDASPQVVKGIVLGILEDNGFFDEPEVLKGEKGDPGRNVDPEMVRQVLGDNPALIRPSSSQLEIVVKDMVANGDIVLPAGLKGEKGEKGESGGGILPGCSQSVDQVVKVYPIGGSGGFLFFCGDSGFAWPWNGETMTFEEAVQNGFLTQYSLPRPAFERVRKIFISHHYVPGP